jgi:hypothetical protein
VLPSVCKSQDFKKNVVYAELLGPGLLYSINYERVITPNFTTRIGASFVPISFDSRREDMFYLFPIMANYLSGEGNSKLELGVGVDVIVDNTTPGVLLVGSLGYRYQPTNGGFHFRIVASPILAPITGFILPSIGCSVGTCF